MKKIKEFFYKFKSIFYKSVLCTAMAIVMLLTTSNGLEIFESKKETEEEIEPKDNIVAMETREYKNELFIKEHNYEPIILTKDNNEQEEVIEEPVIEEVVELTNEEKIQSILVEYELTKDQFDIIVAVVLGEAKALCYEDAYAVINTIFNRTNSYKWSSYIDSIMGSGTGTNLYYQVICPGQFEVYYADLYQKHLGVTDVPGYQAVIDFLYDKNLMHDYLSFYSAEGSKDGKEQFVDGGNIYYNVMPREDKMFEDTLVRTRELG